MYTLVFSRQAKKDIENLTGKQRSKLKELLINIIQKNPYEGKKLIGELSGYFSIRLNIKDRIVYRIDEDNKTVFILMCRTHYKD